MQFKSKLNVGTLYTNLVWFSTKMSEKHMLIFALLFKKLQTWAYLADYIRMCLTNLTKLSYLIDIWVVMINMTFTLKSLKGRCCGNHLTWVFLTPSSGCSFVQIWNAVMPYAPWN